MRMKRPVNFASVLFIAAVLGLWAWHQAPAADRAAANPLVTGGERTALR
jgi:hypothetical protein